MTCAWTTELWDIESVIHAPTRAAARAATIRAAREAGYKVGFLERVRVRRAPYLDELDIPSGELRDLRDAEEQMQAQRDAQSEKIMALADRALARGAE